MAYLPPSQQSSPTTHLQTSARWQGNCERPWRLSTQRPRMPMPLGMHCCYQMQECTPKSYPPLRASQGGGRGENDVISSACWYWQSSGEKDLDKVFTLLYWMMRDGIASKGMTYCALIEFAGDAVVSTSPWPDCVSCCNKKWAGCMMRGENLHIISRRVKQGGGVDCHNQR